LICITEQALDWPAAENRRKRAIAVAQRRPFDLVATPAARAARTSSAPAVRRSAQTELSTQYSTATHI